MSLFYSRQEYIEMHTLDWDIENSPCGECKYGSVGDCQHWAGKCPHEEVD